MGLQDWTETLKRLRESFTEEELNTLIIYEQNKEEERKRQENERPELRLPIPQPTPYQYREPDTEEDPDRGVIIIEM